MNRTNKNNSKQHASNSEFEDTCHVGVCHNVRHHQLFVRPKKKKQHQANNRIALPKIGWKIGERFPLAFHSACLAHWLRTCAGVQWEPH